MRQSLAILSLASSALAASSASMELFWPTDFAINALATAQALPTPAVSVISANPKTTIAAVGCAQDSPDCEYKGITYTKIDTTVYKYAYAGELLPSMTLSVNVDCTSKKDVTCSVGMPEGEDAISIPGVDLSSVLGPFLGMVTYTGDQIAFTTAAVTAGQEKLGGAGASGVMPTGSGNGTVPSGASPTASNPAENTNAANAFGVEVAALFGIVGAAAANLL